MTKRLLCIPTALLLAAGVAACGSSSKAAGIVPVPSGGLTIAASTAATTTPTTATSTTPTTTTPAVTTPTSGPLSKEPTITASKAKPPKALEIKDLIKGTGAAATSSSTVTVDYVGALYSNGKIFDQHTWTDKTAYPAVLGPTPGVIQGWVKGIPGMKVGGRRELIIPPSLAYGASGQGTIPPNATLVFIIDLLKVS